MHHWTFSIKRPPPPFSIFFTSSPSISIAYCSSINSFAAECLLQKKTLIIAITSYQAAILPTIYFLWVSFHSFHIFGRLFICILKKRTPKNKKNLSLANLYYVSCRFMLSSTIQNLEDLGNRSCVGFIHIILQSQLPFSTLYKPRINTVHICSSICNHSFNVYVCVSNI